MPDYKLPNIIFSDENLPNEKTIENYDIYYYEGTKIQFDEKKAYQETIKNGVFDIFANSFLVEASSKKIRTRVDFQNIKYEEATKEEQKFYCKDDTK